VELLGMWDTIIRPIRGCASMFDIARPGRLSFTAGH